MNMISLDQLTVIGATPVEFVDIAADADCGVISLIVRGGDGSQIHGLLVGDSHTRAMKTRLRERGVRVNNLDGLLIKPEMNWDDFARWIEVAHFLEAQRGVTLIFDPEPARAAESFARACELARQAYLPMMIEFTAISQIASLQDTIDYIKKSSEQVGIVVDLLHLAYAGETPAAISNIPSTWTVCAQICDAPANLTFEQYQYHAMSERILPGEGELPVVPFLAALPAGTPIGIEAPLKTRAENGMSHLECARMLRERVDILLASADCGF